MTKAKIAITVSQATLAKAKKAVKDGHAASVSAFFEDAVEQRESREDLIAMIDGMLEESGGPLTTAEKREAERLVAARGRRKRGRAA